MRLLLANHSSYPRVGEGAHAQRVRRAFAKRETGALDDAGFADVVADYTAEIIAEQEVAGLDVVTDGLVGWYDLISHPARNLDNVTTAGIVRFFDTNTYVRQPEVSAVPSGTYGIAAGFTRPSQQTTKTLKAVLPGPYTLARHSIMENTADLASVALGYADALAVEIDALNAAGATLLQIDEPSLLRSPEDAEMVRHLLDRALANKRDLTVSLATYFGDATTVYGELLKMPVDMLALDLIYGPGLVETIVHEGADRPIALGAIDGRNTKLDDTDATAATIGRIVDTLNARGVPEVHLQPSCGLEFLPRDRAVRKLERMREVRDAVTTVSA